MIRHIVFFSFPDDASAERAAEVLRGYAAIPGVEELEIARNERRDAWSSEIDLVLHARFASVEALDGYKRHPIYLEGTRLVRPTRELRFAADYAIEAARVEGALSADAEAA